MELSDEREILLLRSAHILWCTERRKDWNERRKGDWEKGKGSWGGREGRGRFASLALRGRTSLWSTYPNWPQHSESVTDTDGVTP